MLEHYALGLEQGRLDSGQGIVEFERTKEIVRRHLPDPPCVVWMVTASPFSACQYSANAELNSR